MPDAEIPQERPATDVADATVVVATSVVVAPVTDATGPNRSGPDGHDLRLATIGAIALAGRVTGSAVGSAMGAAVGMWRTATRPAAPVARRAVPPVARRTVSAAMVRLDREGRRIAAVGTDAVGRRAGALARDVARSQAVSRTIDELVDQVVWPVIDRVLPDLLDRLSQEPEKVRAIVQGQSQSMVDELVLTARRRAAAGDETADRLIERFFRRPRRSDAAAGQATGPVDDDGPDPALDALLNGPRTEAGTQ